jgi:serine/threonine protein kinase
MKNKKSVGSGGSGKVYKVKDLNSKKFYALKQLPKDGLEYADYHIDFTKEIDILHRLYHDSIEEFPPHYLIRSSGFYVIYLNEVD